MGFAETSAQCPYCQAKVLARRKATNHILHLLITVFTGGLWLPVWIILSLANSADPWRCSFCGTEVKVSTRDSWLTILVILGMLFVFFLAFALIYVLSHKGPN